MTDVFAATLKGLFDAAQAGVRGLPDAQKRLFAVLLLTRLLLLKCVEQKGWLNSDCDYLQRALRRHGAARYWQDFLVPLFFAGVGLPPARRPQTMHALLGNVPLLSAELFAPAVEWDNSQVEVAGAVFEQMFAQVLNRYTFTSSATSADATEHVFGHDLIGYGGERLIADQHSQGAYYTHSAEVDLMCRESLRAYLEASCPQVDRAAIAALIAGELTQRKEISLLPAADAVTLYTALHKVTVCDPAVGSGMFPVAMLRHIFCYKRLLGQLLTDYRPFQELIDQGILTNPQQAYALKAHIIGHSIYGCDIDAVAVQIARLRLWMELVAVCSHPVALPNLYYRLTVGDALVGVAGRTATGKLLLLETARGAATCGPSGQDRQYAPLVGELVALQRRYYATCDPHELQDVRQQLGHTRERLLTQGGMALPGGERTDKHVLWQVDCAEVFQGEQPGFGIVIANPPYVRQEVIDRTFAACGLLVRKADMQALYSTLMEQPISGQADMYAYFLLRALWLLKAEGGVSCTICSNSWLDVDFGRELQAVMLARCHIRAVIDFQAARSFQQAEINTTINLLVTTSQPVANGVARFVTVQDTTRSNLPGVLPEQAGVVQEAGCRIVTVPMDDLRLLAASRAGSAKWGARFLRAPDVYQALLRQAGERLVPLASVACLRRGITTGNNGFFLRTRAELQALQLPLAVFPPVLASLHDIQTLVVREADATKHVLLCPHSLEELRTMNLGQLADYIEAQARRLTRRQGKHTRGDVYLAEARTLRGRTQWWSLREQSGGDVLLPRLIRERFCLPLNPDRLRATDMFFQGQVNAELDPLVVGILLNSVVVYFLLELFGRRNVGGRINLYGAELHELLLPDPCLFAGPQRARLMQLFAPLTRRAIYKIEQELQANDRTAFDHFVLQVMGMDHLYAELADALLQQVHARLKREKAGCSEYSQVVAGPLMEL